MRQSDQICMLKKSRSSNTNSKPRQLSESKPVQRAVALPTLGDMLALRQDQRLQASKSIYGRVRAFINTYVLKKQGSRVVQLLIKWSDNETRAKICSDLLANFNEIVKGKYSIFTLKRMAAYSKKQLFQAVLPNLSKLIVTKPGVQIIDLYFNKLGSPAQITSLSQQISALPSETLQNLVSKALQEGFADSATVRQAINFSFEQMIQIQKQKVRQFASQNYESFLKDRHGIRLFFVLVDEMTSKNKKNILKTVKSKVPSYLENQGFAHLALLKLLQSVDDFVLLKKTLVPELNRLIPKLFENKRMMVIMGSIFNQEHNILRTYYTQSKFSNKKNSQEINLALCSFFIQKMIEVLDKAHLDTLLNRFEESRLLASVLKYILEHSADQRSLDFAEKCFKHMAGLVSLWVKTQVISLDACKIFKSLVGLLETLQGRSYNIVRNLAEHVLQSCQGRVQRAVKSKLSFLLLECGVRAGRVQSLREGVLGVKDWRGVKGQSLYKALMQGV